MAENYFQSSLMKEDRTFEIPLRPQTLKDFIGQESLQERLAIFIGAAQQRKEPLGHCLFFGPPGLGKTTLAGIISKTLQANLVSTSGPAIEKAADLAGLLTNLKEGDVLFIDEIHRLPKTVEELLYSAMEDFVLDLIVDSGPHSRTVRVVLNRFTLVGATTRSGLLSSPLRSRFLFNGRLDYYSPEHLKQIIERSASLLQMSIDKNGSLSIAQRSRGTPRIANTLLRWVRDYAQMHKASHIDQSLAIKALEMLSIDEKGLDEMDKRILRVIIDFYQGGPVGVHTIGVAVGEEPSTLEEVYEPFLILQGFLKRTPRGREVTQLAYEHMGRVRPSND